MAEPILLREQQYHQIKAVLARLRMDASAKVVFLVDKDGQEIASQGEVGNLDTTSLASLAAGNVAAVEKANVDIAALRRRRS